MVNFLTKLMVNIPAVQRFFAAIEEVPCVDKIRSESRPALKVFQRRRETAAMMVLSRSLSP